MTATPNVNVKFAAIQGLLTFEPVEVLIQVSLASLLFVLKFPRPGQVPEAPVPVYPRLAYGVDAACQHGCDPEQGFVTADGVTLPVSVGATDRIAPVPGSSATVIAAPDVKSDLSAELSVLPDPLSAALAGAKPRNAAQRRPTIAVIDRPKSEWRAWDGFIDDLS